MARHGVLAIGLDCLEISLAERLIEQGMLPTLAARGSHDAHLLLDPGGDQRSGLAWERFWSGLSPSDSARHSAVEFDTTTYACWQEGARFGPFFGDADIATVVFDAPYVDLARAPGVQGVVAWGAHDPGLHGAASRPRGLLHELERRVGPYPGDAWLYATPWASTADTVQMGRDLVAGIEARSRAARWLLTDRFENWDLAIVVVSEPHSAAEGLWHGIDPTHPLHDAPSGRAAGEALTAVYRATDQLVGDLLQATDPSAVVVFSMGGMGANVSDAASMVLLPELMLRWSLGERRLEAVDEDEVTWSRSWFRGVAPEAEEEVRSRSLLRRLGAWLPEPTKRRLRRVHSDWRARAQPIGYRSLDWMPAAWYADRWPAMRAFALPSFYDGRVRLNLRGREAAGLVDPADHGRTCDEIEELVRDCVDPQTGRSVVASVERPGADDPRSLDSSLADLVFDWAACPRTFEHPVYGRMGPIPYHRTGGHTGPFGFASLTGSGLAPGDHGIASPLDVAPTVFELVTGRRPAGIAGRSLLDALAEAPMVEG